MPSITAAMPSASGTTTHGDQTHAPPPPLTRVNGIGLWNSWTRNFKTPLLALLDLLDNSVDATFQKAQDEGTAPSGSLGAGGGGTAAAAGVISPDISSSSSCSQSHSQHSAAAAARQSFRGKIHIDADTWEGRTTGMKIINNSSDAFKDLGTIMEVYSSSKGRTEHGVDHSQDDEDPAFADSIGENGVGLKQGCATLSDLSFALTRAADGTMGMAVIAQRLQTAAGVYLPHLYFNSTDLQLLRNEMRKVFSSPLYGSVGACVARYGNENLELGIDRVLRHFAHLSQRGPGQWGEEANVFCVVLHELKHGRKVAQMTMSQGRDEDFVELVPPVEQQHSENAHSLMQELQDELPRNYIHINMEIRVRGEDIHFFYWQRRLAELTMFFINIDENHSYMEAADWQEPRNGYPIRIFCGFDAVRLDTNQGHRGSCSLNIYSRYSGRLIKYEEDARALLKLPSGGTDYSQGLTIIVDDMLGNLPLNPTKQDVAFGEQAHGDVHKRNIFAWLGAITRIYYKHFLETKCAGKKAELTRKVRAVGTPIVDPARLKILDQAHLTEFKDLKWKNMNGTITCTNRKSVEVTRGRDTLFQLAASADPPAAAAAQPKPAKKRKRAAAAAAAPPMVLSDMDLEDDTLPLSVLSSRRQRLDVNYNEDDDNALLAVEVDADVLDDDGLPVVDLAPAQEVTPNRRHRTASSPPQMGQNGVVKQEEEGSSAYGGHGSSSSQQQQGSSRSSQQAAAVARIEIESLREENASLRVSVTKYKDKAHERKKLVRKIDGINKDLRKENAHLKRETATLTANGGTPTSRGKSSGELRLEEQVDQLTGAVEQREYTIKELEDKVAALTRENSTLKGEKGMRREENESLTLKLEEVTNQLVDTQGHQQDGFVLS